MEAKSKEDIISLLTVGGYAEHGEYLYKAGEVLDAMEEHSTQQNSELKEELEIEKRYSGEMKRSCDLMEHKLSALQEENERLRYAIEAVLPYLKSIGSNGNHWVPILEDALHPSHNTEENKTF
jgi:hypothetical protein